MNGLAYPPAEIQGEQLHELVAKIAYALPIIALVSGLGLVGMWITRWSDSVLLGLMAANLSFVLIAAFLPRNRPDHR